MFCANRTPNEFRYSGRKLLTLFISTHSGIPSLRISSRMGKTDTGPASQALQSITRVLNQSHGIACDAPRPEPGAGSGTEQYRRVASCCASLAAMPTSVSFLTLLSQFRLVTGAGSPMPILAPDTFYHRSVMAAKARPSCQRLARHYA